MVTIHHTHEQAQALAAELERRHKTARDFVVPANQIEAVQTEGGLRVAIPDGSGLGSKALYEWGPTALNQTATQLKVPADYAKRIRDEFPVLFNTTINTLSAPREDLRLARTLDGRLRANLSDSFRILDNYDLFFNSYRIAKASGAEISRADLSEDRFEMRFIVPDWRETIKFDSRAGGHKIFGRGKSDIIPGAYVRNSETGKGGLSVSIFLLDQVCTNGMILEQSLRQVHLGRGYEEGFLSREAQEADSKSVWLRVRDIIMNVFDEEKFKEAIARFRATGQFQLAKPEDAVTSVVKDYSLTDEDRQAILDELISPSEDRDPGRTIYGLISAITNRAKQYDDPEDRSALESIAGRLINTPEPELEKVFARKEPAVLVRGNGK